MSVKPPQSESNYHYHHDGATVCCVRAVAITLLAASIIGVISGVFAYLVLAGHYPSTMPVLATLSSIGMPHTYMLLAGSVALFAVSSLALAYNYQASSCCGD